MRMSGCLAQAYLVAVPGTNYYPPSLGPPPSQEEQRPVGSPQGGQSSYMWSHLPCKISILAISPSQETMPAEEDPKLPRLPWDSSAHQHVTWGSSFPSCAPPPVSWSAALTDTRNSNVTKQLAQRCRWRGPEARSKEDCRSGGSAASPMECGAEELAHLL